MIEYSPQFDENGEYIPSPAELAEDQRLHDEWLAWWDRSYLLMKELVDSGQHYHIQDIWLQCLGYQKWLDCDGWDRIGSFLTQGHLMVREAPSAVFAEIGYLTLYNRGREWNLERFMKFVWRQTKMMSVNPQLGHPDMFWRNKLITVQEWAAKQSQPIPKPECYGAWS